MSSLIVEVQQMKNITFKYDGNELHYIQGLAVPKLIKVVWLSMNTEPDIHFQIEVSSEGLPAITSFTATSTPGGVRITPKLLRVSAAKIEDLAIQITAQCCRRVEPTPDGGVTIYHDAMEIFRRAYKQVESATRGQRRRITDAELNDMAAVYKSVETQGLEEVAKVFEMSVPNASRYLKKLRDRGLIPDRRVVKNENVKNAG